MATAIHVPGPCLVRVDAGAGLEDLGYTIEGVDVEETAFFGDVPSDLYGGSDGPPCDVQYFGQIATVSIEMSKFDTAVFDKIRARLANESVGVHGGTASAGALMIGGSETIRLLLLPVDTSFAQNFPIAFPRNPITRNVGTKFMRASCDFECHADQATGVIWNSTTV